MHSHSCNFFDKGLNFFIRAALSSSMQPSSVFLFFNKSEGEKKFDVLAFMANQEKITNGHLGNFIKIYI